MTHDEKLAAKCQRKVVMESGLLSESGLQSKGSHQLKATNSRTNKSDDNDNASELVLEH